MNCMLIVILHFTYETWNEDVTKSSELELGSDSVNFDY